MPARIHRKRWPRVIAWVVALLVFVGSWWWEGTSLQHANPDDSDANAFNGSKN